MRWVWAAAGVVFFVMAVVTGAGVVYTLLHDGDRSIAGGLSIAFVAIGTACGVCAVEILDR